MNTHTPRPMVPHWFLMTAAAMVVSVLAFTAIGRLTGFGVTKPIAATDIGVVDLHFDQQGDGSVQIRHRPTGAPLDRLASDGSGFLRGVYRSLLRERAMKRLDRDAPFQLVRRSDQRHAIVDPQSGSRIELDGFGPSHSQIASRLFDAALLAGTGKVSTVFPPAQSQTASHQPTK